jgi:hypothetical protein
MEEKLNEGTYEKVKAFALSQMAKVKDVSHNDKHTLRVQDNALRIIKLLGIKSVDKNLLKAICLLHDFTYTVRKPSLYTYIFEGHIERRVIRGVLEKFDIPEKEKEIVADAVFRHAHSFPFRKLNKGHSIYSKILQDADTLDFFDCLRVRMFIRKHDKGIFRNLRKSLSNKFVKYGVSNLGSFLNYPQLVKVFFTDPSGQCLVS